MNCIVTLAVQWEPRILYEKKGLYEENVNYWKQKFQRILGIFSALEKKKWFQ